ncbi:MAG TPA: hypothetical protein DHV14_14215, partial [Micrococcales bacterium]|nr:hypothetical protein [Micrococcales bacterium]
RLAGSAVAPGVGDVLGSAHALRLVAEDVPAPDRWAGAALAEETEIVSRWLDQPGVRMLDVTGTGPALPRLGAERALVDLAAVLGVTVESDVLGAPPHQAPEQAPDGEPEDAPGAA